MKKLLIAITAIAAIVACTPASMSPSYNVEDPSSYTLRQTKSAKRGVSFSFATLPDVDVPNLAGAISWSYDWSNRVPSDAIDTQFTKYGLDWCPMVWNGNYSADNIREWKRKHPEAQYILAFNEPNLKDQANMTPAQAAELWPAVVSLAKELNMKLVSPALNYGTLEGYHDPIKWLDEFIAQPQVSADDFVAIALHCYMPSAGSVKGFIDMFEKYGKPIWLTEFCNGNSDNISEDTQLAYMCETINMLESHPNVQRYAWFMPRGSFNSRWHNNLLESAQPFGLTKLGKVFVNLSTADKELFYKPGNVIPAEQYLSATGSVVLEPSTDGGVLDIARLSRGATVTYQLDIPQAGTYKLTIRYQTYMDSSIAFLLDGNEIASKKIPNTSKEWATSGFDIELPAGKSTLTLSGTSGAYTRLNWLQIK